MSREGVITHRSNGQAKIQIPVGFTPSQLDQIEEQRGLMTRTEFIRAAVLAQLEAK